MLSQISPLLLLETIYTPSLALTIPSSLPPPPPPPHTHTLSNLFTQPTIQLPSFLSLPFPTLPSSLFLCLSPPSIHPFIDILPLSLPCSLPAPRPHPPFLPLSLSPSLPPTLPQAKAFVTDLSSFVPLV